MNVKFYLTEYNIPSDTHYQHQSIALIEGFNQLSDINVFANIDYWFVPEEDRTIFSKQDIDRPDVSIYSSSFVRFKEYKLDSNSINVLIDDCDAYDLIGTNKKYEHFDFILKSHYMDKDDYLPNVIPWSFGLSKRIMNSIDKFRSDSISGKNILQTYRVAQNVREYYSEFFKKNQFFREYISDSLQVKESKNTSGKLNYWEQTGRRHNEKYYEKISSERFLLSFCGSFNSKNSLSELLAKVYRKLGISDRGFYQLRQWDSWRFWEGLYSDSVPIHVDFEDWGVKMPVIPENGKHYIGIKNKNINLQIEQLFAKDLSEIEEISVAGRKWVSDNYSPLATAKRFLNLVKR